MLSARRRLTILYHFFHPDDVVSARHFGDFAEELARRDWNVEVLTSNRYCRYPARAIEQLDETWHGVRVHRSRRPAFDQSRDLQRLLNLGWMTAAWGRRVLRGRRNGLHVVGSDPQFSQVLFPIIKAASRHNRVIHWAYDLYPDAIVANAPFGKAAAAARAIRPVVKHLYRYADVLVDLGPCMRRRLATYGHRARTATMTPWALAEPGQLPPVDAQVRRALFGDARLALLYSGNLGKAHEFEPFVELARRARKLDAGIVFCFACRGNRADELRAALRDDDAVRLAPFAREEQLVARLASADLHLMSLRPEWSGIVVPSKFFGSLAVGRPVLYSGPADSSISEWIDEHQVGFNARGLNLDKLAHRLAELASNPGEVQAMRRRAFTTYQRRFSKQAVMDRWDSLLSDELARLHGGAALGAP
ncbi:MAG: glycosyltransferase family 4 protein, partial [Proteobacteria bacterium]|nr:glycosyltransferase family 4 protein [Pseudomonadota bacterium]